MTEHNIPVVAFSAWSGTGKTTLVEKLILHLKSLGVRVAVIKHDAHRFEIDREGKDSWRFAKAGADITIVSSGEKTAIIEQRPRSLWDNISMVHDVDVILLEGYKHEDVPQVGICRKATGKGLPYPPEHYIAIVTDDDALAHCGVPCFGLEDISALTEFLKRRLDIDFGSK